MDTTSVGALVKGLTNPYLPNNVGKPNYISIKETHQILESNAASVEKTLGRGQNSYLVLVLLSSQYA